MGKPNLHRLFFEHALPALIWLFFAVAMVQRLSFLVANQDWLHAIRQVLNLAFTLLLAMLFILRKPLQGARARPLEAIVAVMGTFTPFLLPNLTLTFDNPVMLVVSYSLVIAGLIWSIVALAALGRYFGLFPEARGLVTTGPYRIVRHPLYFGEIVVFLGALLPALSSGSVLLWAAWVGVQVWRTKNEERALEKVFPEYADYRTQTYRLVPFVW